MNDRDWTKEPALPVGETREYDGVVYTAVREATGAGRFRDRFDAAALALGVGRPITDLCFQCPASLGACGLSLCDDNADVFIVREDSVPVLALAGILS